MQERDSAARALDSAFRDWTIDVRASSGTNGERGEQDDDKQADAARHEKPPMALGRK